MNQPSSNIFKRWLAVLSLVVGIVLGARAENVKVGDLRYETNTSAKTAYVTYESTASTNYSSLSGVVEIPEKITFSGVDYTVTAMGASAFKSASKVTEVKIPNTVTTISNYAFDGCSSLTTLTIPSSVTQIGSFITADNSSDFSNVSNWGYVPNRTGSPFKGCTALKTIRFEDGTKTLKLGSIYQNYGSYTNYNGAGLFYDCPLAEIYLGRNIEYIEGNYYSSFSNAPQKYGYSAFSRPNNTLKSVVLGETVSSIPQYLFYGCNKIESIISFNASAPSANTNTFPTARNAVANVYVPKSGLSNYQSSLKWCDFTHLYPMIEQDNLLFVPIDETSVAVTKFPNTSPESITIPATVSDEDGEYNVTAVYESAFKECPDLTLVEFPATLTDIRPYAFANNTKLASLTFNGQTKIDEYAFANCPSITSLNLPQTLKEISSHAFFKNTSITSISFGTCLESIGQSAFGGCTSLTAIKLPDTLEHIESSGFEDCIKLTYATLGNSLKTLGNSSFKNCKALTEIATPNTTVSIGHSAFEDCSNLSLATLNNGLLTMGNNTFKGCESLLSMTIPGTVTSIGSGSFDGCSMISSVNFQAGSEPIKIAHFPDSPIKTLRIGRNMTYACSGVSSPFIDKKTLTRVLFSGNYVTNLYDYLFDGCSSISLITLPSNLETINTYVFRGCSGLSSMSIPGSVVSIGTNSFDDCEGIKALTFEDGESDLTLGAKSGMFTFSPLESLYIGRNIKHTAEKAELSPFYGRHQLTDLRISDAGHVTSLCDYFVDDASKLSVVNIPESVTEIGIYGFANCISIENIKLPSKLGAISNALFRGCTNLKGLSIPASVASVGNWAIRLCPSMTELTFEDSSNEITVGIANPNLGMCAETSLEKLYVGRNIEYTATASSGYSPFYGLSNLKDVTFNMNGTVTHLGDYYLAGCSAVENLVLPQSISTIGSYGFYNDYSLATISFPTKVEILKNNLFHNCSKLGEFTIYPAVTSIEDNVFTNCASLSKVSFQDNNNLLTVGRRNLNSKYASIFADSPIESLYLGRWLVYDVNDETTSPFYSQTYLTDLKFGPTVGDLGKFLFEKCSALKVANIPGVESIGEKAFYDCVSLNDLTLNNGTKSLGELSFANCSALKNVKLPQSVISLSDGCFMNCTNLISADLGTSLEIIDPRAFNNCSSLGGLLFPKPFTVSVSNRSKTVLLYRSLLYLRALVQSVLVLSKVVPALNGLH